MFDFDPGVYGILANLFFLLLLLLIPSKFGKLFAITLYVSAELLFLVEPMIAKMILPSLGGTPAVWNTCMVFFQASLLAGYAYAHVTTKWLGVRRQAALHAVLLFLPLLVLPISVARGGAPPADMNPVLWVLGLLAVSVGPPFFVLSSSAPLLQKWFASTGDPSAKDPYFLYAASNLGSLLALVSYPAFVEPGLRLLEQSRWWTIGYASLVFLTLLCAVVVWRSAPQPNASRKEPAPKQRIPVEPPPSWGRRLYWVALAAVPSSLMLGVTTHATTDIAAIPLLWVIPLALYLLSFIIVFARMPVWFDKLLTLGLLALAVLALSSFLPDMIQVRGFEVEARHLRNLMLLALLFGLFLFHPRVGPVLHRAMVLALPVLIIALVFVQTQEGVIPHPGNTTLIGFDLVLLFVTAMVCHGELVRTRPPTDYLTAFYLWMSFGGVVGGMFNALVAPLVFTQIAEYRLAMVAACMLLPTLFPESKSRAAFWTDVVLAVVPGLLGFGLIAFVAWNGKHLNADNIRAVVGADSVRFSLLSLAAVAAAAAYVLGKRQEWAPRLLDVIAGLSLGLLSLGLVEGLEATEMDFTPLARIFHGSDVTPEKVEKLKAVLMYGLPVLFCYTLLARSVRFGLGVGALLLASVFSNALTSDVIYRDRSFFGTLSVSHKQRDNSNHLVHGTTLHGLQYLDGPEHTEPQTYYHRTGPIGQVMEKLILPHPEKEAALIGLGTGTLASYADKGRRFTFYDIDPHVVTIARDTGLFTYYSDAVERGADLKIVLGDARLRIKDSKDEQYSLIVVDAFSSDAIPVHLITQEALELYLSKLAEGGVVAFHTSNRYLDLEPVVANLAATLGLQTILYNDHDDSPPGKSRSTWVLVARQMKDFGELADKLSNDPDAENCWRVNPVKPEVGVWSDDYSNLLGVFMEWTRQRDRLIKWWNKK